MEVWPVICTLAFFGVIRQIQGIYNSSNILAHYRLDGSDKGISVNNVSLVGGRYPGSKAMHFIQNDSYISTPQIVLNQKSFTIACWIKVASLAKNLLGIYGDWSAPKQFILGVKSAGQLRFLRQREINGSNKLSLVTSRVVPMGQWTHVAVTWNQNEGLVLLHIDAVKDASNKFDLDEFFLEPAGHEYRIGNAGDFQRSSNQFYGAIMDLCVLDVALSPDELNQLRGFPRIVFPIPAAVARFEHEILKCRAEGLPSPHVTWLHNGQIVVNGTSLAILKIPKAGEKHEGSYKCVASNMLGETSKVVNIKVVDRGSFPVFLSTPCDADFRLKDHLIYTVREVTNLFHCMSYCSLQEGCESFNFSPQDQVCELNDATKTSHDGDYKAEKSFVYYEKGGRIIDVGDTRYNG